MSQFPSLSAASKNRSQSSGPLVSSMLALFWATIVLAGVMGVSRIQRSEVNAMQGPPSPPSEDGESSVLGGDIAN